VGPYHPPPILCFEIETPKASRGWKRGERCPLTIRLGFQGSVVSSPCGVRCGAPAENDFMYILGPKEAIWNTIFSIFVTAEPPNVAGPGKTSPLSTGLKGTLWRGSGDG